jgi:hypothetical protein
MTAKKTEVTIPKVEVVADRNIFSVKIDNQHFFGPDVFEFTISNDGDVTINDNTFSSKKEAATVLEAMAKFLRK